MSIRQHTVTDVAAGARVKGFYHAPTNTWSYVVSDPFSGAAAVIDAVLDYEHRSGRTSMQSMQELIAYIREQHLKLEWILETHAHADHLSGADALKHSLGGRTAIGAGIVQVQETFKRIYNLGDAFASDGLQFDRLLQDGDEIKLGSIAGRVIATPGHTNDSVSFLFGSAVFVGDTVFMPDGGTARCDFPGGDATQLYSSIKKLYTLPEETRVYVCHDYPAADRAPASNTSLREHKLHNTQLNEQTGEADFVRFRRARDASLEVPLLMIPAVQVNIRAGRLPDAESNGLSYLKIPLNVLGHKKID